MLTQKDLTNLRIALEELIHIKSFIVSFDRLEPINLSDLLEKLRKAENA